MNNYGPNCGPIAIGNVFAKIYDKIIRNKQSKYYFNRLPKRFYLFVSTYQIL